MSSIEVASETAIAPAPKAEAAKTNTSLYVGDLNLDVNEPVLFEVRVTGDGSRACLGFERDDVRYCISAAHQSQKRHPHFPLCCCCSTSPRPRK